MNFPRHTHHICLVSEQTLPNYLGAIVPDALPHKVHLVVTERMKERAGILEKALSLRGCKVEQHPLAAPLPNPMMDVLDAIYAQTGPDVAVNVTGGTKIMALAAVEWAGIQDAPPFLFYVDTDRGQILQLGGKHEQFAMNTKLRLKELLKAGAGVDILSQDETSLSATEREQLERLGQTFMRQRSALNLFNKCAKEAETGLYADMPYAPSPEFQQALAIAQQAGKLHVTADKIKYESENSRKWCNGGWLEAFVKARLYKLKSLGVVDDWASNLEISKGLKPAPAHAQRFKNPQNELDAAFTAANRFFVIECKTANLAMKGGFSAASYKLDALRRSLGGTLAKGMIVSVHTPRPEDIQRCEDLRVDLLYGDGVLNLEEKLEQWIRNANR